MRGRAASLGIVGSAALLVVGALTLIGIGFVASAAWPAGSTGQCADGSDRVALSVTAAPQLAAPISRLAGAFNRTHAAGGPCATITVSATASDQVLDALSRRASTGPGGSPDIWIPESADWLELGQESTSTAGQLPAKATTIAGSPVVIAMPRPMAQALGWPEHHLTWAELVADANEPDFWAHHGQPRWGQFRLAMANPENSAPALRAVIGTVSAARGIAPADMTNGTFDQDHAAERAVLRLQRSLGWLPGHDSQLFSAIRTGGPAAGSGDATVTGAPPATPSAFPALESDVIAYNRTLANQGSTTGAPSTLVASYPTDGTFTAMVPYIVMNRTAGVGSRLAAANAFAAFLRSGTGRAALTAAGLRTPAELVGQDDPQGLSTSLNATDGVRTTPPKAASTDASDSTLGTARRFFRHTLQRGATLAVLDTSGPMAAAVPGADPPQSRMQAAIDTYLAGLRLFAPDSDVGLWQFSGALAGAQGYRELAPLAALGGAGQHGTHLDDLTAAPGRLTPAGGSDLYATTLAAFRYLTQHYVAGRLNQVVVLTGGHDDVRPGPTALSLSGLLDRLQAEYDPKRPVSVITVAYGDDPADLAALQRVSAATGGRSYVSPDADGVFDMYINALTRSGS